MAIEATCALTQPMSSTYLSRYAVQTPYLNPNELGNPEIVIVIPCHSEPNLIASLTSLESCDPVDKEVLVIVVINASANADQAIIEVNLATYRLVTDWIDEIKRRLNYQIILENELSPKHAGVGLARKIGMDEAVRIFESKGRDGVIACFDADSLCQRNYLVEIERLFKDKKVNGCSIHFEHPLEGDEMTEIYQGIINYELHLRYFVNAQRFAGAPFAYQTIGSSMAVRSSAYQKQGGMNRRKAGEDFYFLHKIISLGGFRELTSTCVIPSPRVSSRVPFGTGKAIGDWIAGNSLEWQTYHPNSFCDLRLFFEALPGLFDQNRQLQLVVNGLPPSITDFCGKADLVEKVIEIRKNVSSYPAFEKRFFQWFDAFQLMKFVHFARDNHYPNVTISEAVKWFLKTQDQQVPETLRGMLIRMRELDKARGDRK